MFEHLEQLRPELAGTLSQLTPLSQAEIGEIRLQCPECPAEYITFLQERGYGPLLMQELDRVSFFVFEQRLLSAIDNVFRDADILEEGAKGDVMVFGFELSGIAYGFDTGDGWNLVEIDEDRVVEKLGLSFKQFVEGLLVCYPHFPHHYKDGVWLDVTGEAYEPQPRPDRE